MEQVGRFLLLLRFSVGATPERGRLAAQPPLGRVALHPKMALPVVAALLPFLSNCSMLTHADNIQD